MQAMGKRPLLAYGVFAMRLKHAGGLSLTRRAAQRLRRSPRSSARSLHDIHWRPRSDFDRRRSCPALNCAGRTSVDPRQDLLQVCKEPLPPVFGALVGLLLIRPEARLLHAQVGSRARWGESPSDDTLQTIGRPRVRQRFVRLHCHDLTVDSAPVCAKIETVVHDRLEIVLHQPLLNQVWLGERAPDLFRRIRYLTFDNDGERFGRGIGHWSILFSKSSRWSNRLCQNPAIWLVQSIRGASAPSCAL